MMKWVLRLIGALLLILVVAGIGLLLLPAERIAGIAAEQLRKVTGRNVTISGDVGMTFWPVLGVRAGQLEVGNADWAKERAMLSTSNAAIGVDASALLRGEIVITNIEAQSPTIRLESRHDGRASWQFTDAGGTGRIETETTPARAPRPITIRKLTITDATLIYDAEGADLVSFSGVDLALDWPEAAGPARIDATLRPADTPVRLGARVENFAAFIGGDVSKAQVDVSTDGGSLTLDGRANLQGAVAGALRIKTGSTSAFLAALGISGVTLPKGLGQSLDVSSQITLTPDRQLALRDLVADLGGNTLRGGADIGLDGTPQINAQLQAGALDLRAAASGPGSDGDGGRAAGAGWSRDRIDASFLSAFNGNIGLSAQSVELGSLSLGETRIVLRNDRARMVFELARVAVFDGVVAGEFVMNNRSGLSVGGDLTASAIDMNRLLSDLAGLTRFSGTGDARLSFLGVGQSADAIVRSLKGEGAINVGRGSIEGIDLDNLLGSFDVKGGTTVFDSLTASFGIDAGVLRNSDLLMSLPNFNATGQGQVDLGAQTLDYTVVPKALKVNAGRGLAVPVRIHGPWADPSITPDLKAALDLNFSEEKARAEERVKQKLEEKLQEELGITRQEGQSVEDAVKDQVEDKLRRELLKIFE